MGADWYDFFSTTAAAIPVPKDALQQPFDLQGLKLMTVMHDHYDEDLEESHQEYHGAMICVADTELYCVSVEAMGPYETTTRLSGCQRMKHLDGFMTAETRERLIGAFETYTGHKPDVKPGFWTLSATAKHHVNLHTTWSLKDKERIVDGHAFDGSCEDFSFSVALSDFLADEDE
ncbi:unnamed protein product [Mortierella alpina]